MYIYIILYIYITEFVPHIIAYINCYMCVLILLHTCVPDRLHMCPHVTTSYLPQATEFVPHVISYIILLHICVPNRLHMCPHISTEQATEFVPHVISYIILLHMCPQPATYVSSYYYLIFTTGNRVRAAYHFLYHTATYVSPAGYICMCPHISTSYYYR
jgi:hypothetical protein